MKEIKFPILKRIDDEIIDLYRSAEERAKVRSMIATRALLEVKRINGSHFLNWIPVDVSDDLYESVWRQHHMPLSLSRLPTILTVEAQRYSDTHFPQVVRAQEVRDEKLSPVVPRR